LHPAIRDTYTTYPVTFKRPETGQRLEQIACPNCRLPLEVLVRSRAAVEGFRTRLRVIGAGLFGYALVDLAFLFPGSGATMQKVWGSTLALAVLAAVGVLGYSMVPEFSLALVTKVSLEPDHKLFETLEPGRR